MIHQCIDILDGKENAFPSAKLITYVIENSPAIDPSRVRPAIIICPGGGYNHTSDREAEPIALQMIANGFHAFVLRYNVAPAEYPQALLELAASVKLVKERAAEWNIDPNRVFISGFSAGGHLAFSHAVFWSGDFLAKELHTTKEMLKPFGCLLSYPVITSGEFAHRDSFIKLLGSRYEELSNELSLENKVNEQVPPVFLWHTLTDPAVPVENSLLLINALRRYHIPTEFHMYPIGGHGLALATEETKGSSGDGILPECAGWIRLAIDWMKYLCLGTVDTHNLI